MGKIIFCQWVDAEIDVDITPAFCKEFIIDNKCTYCNKSPQVELGTSPKDLMRNISDK